MTRTNKAKQTANKDFLMRMVCTLEKVMGIFNERYTDPNLSRGKTGTHEDQFVKIIMLKYMSSSIGPTRS